MSFGTRRRVTLVIGCLLATACLQGAKKPPVTSGEADAATLEVVALQYAPVVLDKPSMHVGVIPRNRQAGPSEAAVQGLVLWAREWRNGSVAVWMADTRNLEGDPVLVLVMEMVGASCQLVDARMCYRSTAGDTPPIDKLDHGLIRIDSSHRIAGQKSPVVVQFMIGGQHRMSKGQTTEDYDLAVTGTAAVDLGGVFQPMTGAERLVFESGSRIPFRRK